MISKETNKKNLEYWREINSSESVIIRSSQEYRNENKHSQESLQKENHPNLRSKQARIDLHKVFPDPLLTMPNEITGLLLRANKTQE